MSRLTPGRASDVRKKESDLILQRHLRCKYWLYVAEKKSRLSLLGYQQAEGQLLQARPPAARARQRKRVADLLAAGKAQNANPDSPTCP